MAGRTFLARRGVKAKVMRASVLAVLTCAVLGALGCGEAPLLPPGAAMLARFQVKTHGIPDGRELKRLAVVQDQAGGPRLDRAVADALRKSGLHAELLPAGTVDAEQAARGVGADAIVRVAIKVRYELRQQTGERITVSRPKTGFGTYITPPSPTGVPEGELYPLQAQEKTVIFNPLEQHMFETEVRLEVVRVRDGKVLAAWRQDLGAFRVDRPAPGKREGHRGAPGTEEVPPGWQALLDEVGGEVVRWLQAPEVVAERAVWKIDAGPAKVPTRRGIDAARADDWGGAEAAFREALALAPGDPRTHANLAVALERRGDRAGARAELGAAARLDKGVRFAGVLHDFAKSFLPPPDPKARVQIPASAPASAPAKP
jgi:hypothetical protein